MTRTVAALLAVLLAVGCQRAVPNEPVLPTDAGPPPECSEDALRRFVERAPTMPLDDKRAARSLLLEMFAMDQCQRQLLSFGASVDAHNSQEIERMVDHYGWPGRRTWGKEADFAAFLIVQHSDNEAFQERVLAMLDRLRTTGDTSPTYWAYLDDRLNAVRKQRPQHFGSQGGCVGTGVWRPLPIEDEAGVEKRRQALGMEPLADYVEHMNGICQGELVPP